MKPTPTSPARYLHLLMRLLEQRDIDCASALAPLGIDRARLAHPAAKVPTLPTIEVFRHLVAEHGGPSLGLDVGRLITWGQLGELGQAMLCSETLGEALLCAEAFYAVVAPSFRMQVERLPDAVALTWLPVQAMPYDFVLFCFDMAMATMDGLLAQMLGDAAPVCDAYLTRARPAHIDAYKRLRRIRCHFGQPGVPSLRLSLPPALWGHPMAMRNVDELAVLRARLAQRVQTVASEGMATWVEMMLRMTAGEQPSQAFLAQVAGMSASTLARRLASEGETFRGIANRVRHERACELLREGAWTVADVGAQLGYADTPSFVRAFKAMGGVTPGRFAQG